SCRMAQTIFVFEQADPIIPLGPFTRDLKRAVRRTVIEYDQLKISKGLRDDAANGLVQKTPGIMNRHDHADLWLRRKRHTIGKRLSAQSADSTVWIVRSSAFRRPRKRGTPNSHSNDSGDEGNYFGARD